MAKKDETPKKRDLKLTIRKLRTGLRAGKLKASNEVMGALVMTSFVSVSGDTGK